MRRRAAAEAGCPFDLERAPLLRTSLLQLARQKHVLFSKTGFEPRVREWGSGTQVLLLTPAELLAPF